MKTIGLVLLVLGILGLIYGGIDYTRDRTILQVGDVEIGATEHKRLPVPAIVGAVVLIGGAVFLIAGRRRAGVA